MEQIKTIIVDDDESNIELLSHFIEKYCSSMVEIVGTATTVDDAVELIQKLKPHLFLLDIILNNSTSFEILEKIPKYNYKIIFVTAYDKFAVKAFKYHAVDYLLKPVQIEELVHAINESYKDINNYFFTSGEQVTRLVESVNKKESTFDFIAIPSVKEINFVRIEEIAFCKSEGRYTIFHLVSGEELVVTKNLGEYDGFLNPNFFFRVHNSYLVNLKQVENILKTDGYYCNMKGGKVIPIAKRRQEKLHKFLGIR